jgi:hypothetical protein
VSETKELKKRCYGVRSRERIVIRPFWKPFQHKGCITVLARDETLWNDDNPRNTIGNTAVPPRFVSSFARRLIVLFE